MLEYSIKEAEALLSKNLNTAQKNLKEIEEDLGFLRDQYTTTEVSILQIIFESTCNNALIYKWKCTLYRPELFEHCITLSSG